MVKTAAEVEDKHGVPLEVVVVGDCPLDAKLSAQMQAAREAMVKWTRCRATGWTSGNRTGNGARV